MVMPLNVGKNHWITVIIRPYEQSIWVYDFLYLKSQTRYKRIIRIQYWWNKHIATPLGLPEITRVHKNRDLNGIQQHNGDSCGVYVCVLCKCIMEGALPTNNVLNDALMETEHRRMIFTDIWDYFFPML